MERVMAVILLLSALAFACGEEEGTEESEDVSLDFPHTVTLKPEQGLIASTGEILDHADFISGDLVTYKDKIIKVQTGCEVSQAHCRPLHVCRLGPGSKPVIFESHDQTCQNYADEEDPSVLLNAETGVGFTTRLNTQEGYGRFWVKEVSGMGDSATITLVYSIFYLPQ